MITFLRQLALLLICAMMVVPPLHAASSIYTTKFTNGVIITGGLTVDTLTNTGAITATTTVTGADLVSTDDVTVGDDLTVTDDALVSGDLTVTGSTTLTTPLTAANIQSGSAKRQVFFARLAPETGVCADATAYRATIFPGRAGTVTKITYGTSVDPVSGTNVITVEKGSYSGNTMLSAASVSLNGATANTAQTATLTATSADLALLATEPICCEYNAGTQGTDAEQVSVTVEFEPTNF